MYKFYTSIYIILAFSAYTQDIKKDTVKKSTINLNEVIVSDAKQDIKASEVISNIDQKLRPTNSAQDLLRLVPGLFIAQHAGGGKAEQIFFRGFDIDHGTDFSVNIDGMPVNMVSHAHGQGYADFHFVIPETVDKLKIFKGTIAPQYGDFATAGAAEFSTKNKLDNSIIKLEYGRFDTYRALAMVDLLNGKKLFGKDKEDFYIAGEYNFTNAYFEVPQKFHRYNIFTKYSLKLNANHFFQVSASTFNSKWDASGQIPERAVSENKITRFGSIDPTEGGNTGRTNVNVKLNSTLKNGALLKNQIFYNYYDFNLYSNFTFFLNDSINGDQINQSENGRSIYGYKLSYEKKSSLMGKLLNTEFGIGTRIDDGINNLNNSIQRRITNTIINGRVTQQNAQAYLSETLLLNNRFSINPSLRLDYFDFKYQDLQSDSLSGRQQIPKLSPKLNLNYEVNNAVQLYAHIGNGFHSNDARSVVQNKNQKSLPSALGYEVGSTFKLGKSLIVHAALWGLDLENELVYVGDEAIVEITGATRRLGTDLALRWQISNHLFIDADFNYNYGRYKKLPKNENFIPLAPRITSIGGITYKSEKGLNASMRYRHIDTRPANEDNSVQAKGYFLLDAVANYTWSKFQIGVSAENLLNAVWNEAQFDTESKLRFERQSVNELHYTPGTPFFIKGNISFFF